MSLIVDEHRGYVADARRVAAFARAIDAVVRPGDVVIDLGSGTGLLGILACRAGAARVYALEANGMIEVARAVAAANGVADRIVHVKRHSMETTLPEPADVLVSDFLGGIGFEAAVFPLYADARRLLKPGARVMPSRIDMHAAPVEDAAFHAEIMSWKRPVAGVDLSPVLAWARNTGYPRMLAAASLLASSTVHTSLESTSGPDLIRLRGTVTIERPGTVHGIGGWFDAMLAPDVMMSNAPGRADRPEGKRNLFLPLDEAAAVDAGDRVSLHVRIRPADAIVAWDVEIEGAGAKRRERHSTLDGMLVAREDLDASAPASTPRLTPRGDARRTVLDLCDGSRTLGEIERTVLERHPALFPAAGDVQAFVAEILTRYTEYRR